MADVAATPTVLVEEHRRLGAQLAPFAGFLMPIRYGAIFAEHQAVRERAGLFDLSHMGQLELEGEGALELLQRIGTNTVDALRAGKARYSILTQADGGAIDDIIVYRLATSVLVVANAANTARVIAALNEHAPQGLRVTHRSDRALIALQGPKSAQILAPLVDADPAALANYASVEARFGTMPFLLARTGYTGEDGFELFVAADDAIAIWRTLLEAGAPHGVRPSGLAARDILRLEAGMPLYGNELSEKITPLQAGLGWAVRFDKGDFIGRDALIKQRDTDYARIIGLRLTDRIPARGGYAVYAGDRRAGEIVSATIAPSVGGASIATALIEAAHAENGHTLAVEIRGTLYPAEVVPLPFYRRRREPVTPP